MFFRKFNNKGIFFKEKIFVISMQRTGTKSTGQFFRDHGYSVAHPKKGRDIGWSKFRFEGNYQAIFDHKYFKESQVFEDDPWWSESFYKYLYYRFPNSKFILIERDADKWFASMMRHSGEKTIGNTHRHSVQYNRLNEFYEIPRSNELTYLNEIDNLMNLSEENRSHYTSFYRSRNREVLNFFRNHQIDRLFHGQLEDSELWIKLGEFFSINVQSGYGVHRNKKVD